MEGNNNYLELKDLKTYQLAREYSNIAWNVYKDLHWQEKKVIGDQFVRAVDSVGANIAEGYGRFHYLDKNKFYYNARASLLEVQHWVSLLYERKIINHEKYMECYNLKENILLKLNGLIKSQYFRKQNS